ncbi:hypothetical protein D1AOALGA4SA_11382 [Olavius algarvensis Delta 1 endosymbiont]|nr:hypothetical protein D1AOALGA4SA_11382 [Olavius algarvensis Delta 1 endosymbiont]
MKFQAKYQTRNTKHMMNSPFCEFINLQSSIPPARVGVMGIIEDGQTIQNPAVIDHVYFLKRPPCFLNVNIGDPPIFFSRRLAG